MGGCTWLGSNIMFHQSGLDFQEKHWGQLAPKFSDWVASTSILVAKHFQPFRPFIYFHEKDAEMAQITVFSKVTGTMVK